jgi:hypothetical protein
MDLNIWRDWIIALFLCGCDFQRLLGEAYFPEAISVSRFAL